MKIFLLTVFSIYLAADWVATFKKWLTSKSNKEYWFGFFDTVITSGLLIGFVKLIEEATS